ncbi:NAD(P)H-hydrate dehydratase [Falsarthrobacter nasiphocae]|uniref:ADP-dependent (S)-NAD(P)H-hydrate dehydratase n=1 Tax=Falsarthrobacter nasiphocae TaxID=189863 RepID=A0AAE3YGM1_9MICC|nr:NAD(P)H-hydrate dehydratase [Falsarthrobacter nasiphocae]MDR6891785.1 hydroxyethylthiazole kinase-like uncharacterized protein yjeF [Falsarthrobacter nasiphocae]
MMFSASDAAHAVPRPAPDAHKYSRGVVGLSTGTARYPGAAVLGVRAALAAGVGMVRYRGPESVAHLVLASRPEAVVEPREGAPGHCQAWVIGSGMEEDDDAAAELDRLSSDLRSRGGVLVVDAGALGAVRALRLGERLGERAILTPHAGELARLASAAGAEVSRERVEAEPADWAARMSEDLGCTVLLKGRTTVVASPDGTRVPVRAGHPWLATAGTGDLLAGVIGALAATSEAGPLDVAAAGAWIHGRAGRTAADSGPFGASDLPPAIRRVVRGLTSLHGPDDTEHTRSMS